MLPQQLAVETEGVKALYKSTAGGMLKSDYLLFQHFMRDK